jgi:hypothetical protein
MSVTGVSPTPRSGFFLQVDKLVASSPLRGSESLCRLLHYLAERSVDQPAGIKEYQIATEVFGRPADFDPRLDATVRVQTSRLRAKLVEYYAVEGAADPWILELPKGSYTLTFHARPPAEIPPPVPPADPPARSDFQAVRPIGTGRARPWASIFHVLSLLCIGLLTALALVISRRPVPQVSASVSNPAPQSLQTFWHGFIDQPEPPLVVFSNAEFVGRPESGMRYFNPAMDSRDSILDHYTGVGEVIAIHELDRLFTLMHHDLRVKRGRLLSLDDVKNTDLVFVGSPSENLTLREIATTQEFAFRTEADGDRKGDLAIVNPNPRPGEDRTYLATKGVPLTEDYAVIAVFPGAYPPSWVMILAGTSTIGTQAAVEFVCRELEVRELVRKVGISKTGEVLPFEAVIHVKVSRGVPVASKLVALHPRTAP